MASPHPPPSLEKKHSSSWASRRIEWWKYEDVSEEPVARIFK